MSDQVICDRRKEYGRTTQNVLTETRCRKRDLKLWKHFNVCFTPLANKDQFESFEADHLINLVYLSKREFFVHTHFPMISATVYHLWYTFSTNQSERERERLGCFAIHIFSRLKTQKALSVGLIFILILHTNMSPASLSIDAKRLLGYTYDMSQLQKSGYAKVQTVYTFVAAVACQRIQYIGQNLKELHR